MDLDNWTIEALKKELETRKISNQGKKEELMQRLISSGYSQGLNFQNWGILSLKNEARKRNLEAFGANKSILVDILTKHQQTHHSTNTTSTTTTTTTTTINTPSKQSLKSDENNVQIILPSNQLINNNNNNNNGFIQQNNSQTTTTTTSNVIVNNNNVIINISEQQNSAAKNQIILEKNNNTQQTQTNLTNNGNTTTTTTTTNETTKKQSQTPPPKSQARRRTSLNGREFLKAQRELGSSQDSPTNSPPSTPSEKKATSTPPSSPKSKVGNSLGLSLIQDYQSPDVVNVRTSPRRSTRRVSNLGTINNDSDGLKQQTLKVQSVSIPKTPPRSPKRKISDRDDSTSVIKVSGSPPKEPKADPETTAMQTDQTTTSSQSKQTIELSSSQDIIKQQTNTTNVNVSLTTNNTSSLPINATPAPTTTTPANTTINQETAKTTSPPPDGEYTLPKPKQRHTPVKGIGEVDMIELVVGASPITQRRIPQPIIEHEEQPQQQQQQQQQKPQNTITTTSTTTTTTHKELTSFNPSTNKLDVVTIDIKQSEQLTVTKPTFDFSSPRKVKSASEPPKIPENFVEPSPLTRHPSLLIPASPRSIMKSPAIKVGTPKKSVEFRKVEVRAYERAHAGGSGVPDSGFFPLGLNWNVVEKKDFPLDKYEVIRKQKSTGLEVIHEPQRKRLLEQTAGSIDEEHSLKLKQEFQVLRKSRQKVGCSCRGPSQCVTNKCACYKDSIECMGDACECTSECKNTNGKTVFLQEENFAIRMAQLEQLKKETFSENKTNINTTNTTTSTTTTTFSENITNINTNTTANTTNINTNPNAINKRLSDDIVKL